MAEGVLRLEGLVKDYGEAEARTRALNAIADGIYARWVEGLDRS